MTLPDSKLAHFAQPDSAATWCRDDVHAMAVELMERRAADVTDEEREALHWLRKQANAIQFERATLGLADPHTPRALATLDKLLGGAR